MKHLRVLLIDPCEILWLGRARSPSTPVNVSLLSLFSYLRHHDIDDISLLDLSLEPGLALPLGVDELAAFEDRCVDLLSGYEYDVAAITCFTTYQYQASLLVARASRRARPDAATVVGGWHSLSEPGDFVTPDCLFDFVVSGAGDKPLLAIARGEIRRTPGKTQIIRQEQLTPAEHTALRYLVRDYVAAAPSRYATAFATGTQGFIATSRGCPFACVFCANSFDKPGWWALPVDRCLELIAEMQAALPRLECCYFGDALFGAQTKWRREMLRALAGAFPNLPTAIITRSDFLEPVDVELLAANRGMYVVLGVETLAADMISVMHKATHPDAYVEKTMQAVSRLSAAGVLHEVFIILDHPGETETTLAQTCRNLERVVDRGASIMTFRYMHFPQFVRDYADYQRRFGTQFRGDLRWWMHRRATGPEMLQNQYVASSGPGEPFENAKARIERAVSEAIGRCAPFYRGAKTHADVIGQML
jgi:radical SAM superfamily enzyme YgiQ (UPF0313 family)